MGRNIVISLLCSLLCCWQQAVANDKPVRITASSWLVADSNGKVIESRNAEEQRSIASITKLMTAMVVLDAKQDLDEHIVTTQSMQFSPFKKPFEDRILNWNNKLKIMSDVLEEWAKCQG